MNILSVTPLAIPEVKVVRFARFKDDRGYFTETFRKKDFHDLDKVEGFQHFDIQQVNESCSQKNVIRGLHFQWNDYQGKLVRTLYGHMADIALDIRQNSPTFGKAIVYDMPADPNRTYDEWIWIPIGFAHGNVYFKDSAIEYFCTSPYSPGNEAGIYPLANDIDWSLTDSVLVKKFREVERKATLSSKDKQGYTMKSWSESKDSEKFVYTNR